ncbi:DUF2789 domain-containing protein [soil metagenome]
MNLANHRFHDLFAQLGLPSDEDSIAQFIAEQPPLAAHIKLSEAPFWTAAQATFLREALQQDSEWAELADQLNLAMR